MSKTKIVFFDIDQTLHRKETGFMPESAKQAIAQLRQNGILTAISTGRSTAALPPYISAMIEEGYFDILVSINGQYNYRRLDDGTNEIISQYPMSKNYIKTLIHYAQARELDYAGVADTGIISRHRGQRAAQALKGIGDIIIDDTFPDNNNIYQMLLFITPDEEKELIENHMVEKDHEIMRWHELAVDLVKKTGAKRQGILDVCQFLNIKVEETMAFGDGHNDLAMIESVGIGVAMGDALPEIKDAADYVTAVLEEDGIYRALQHFSLI